jgi:hypothetical protein
MSRRSSSILIALLAGGGCTLGSTPILDPRDGGVDSEIALDAALDAPPVDAGFMCAPGEPGCWGSLHYVCGSERDTRTEEVECAEACDPRLGCVTCVPGSHRCDGNVSMVCADDGSGWHFGRDCTEWDATCGTVSGTCDDACARAEQQRTYVGCEYWPTPLANTRDLDRDEFDFRLVVTNPARELAEVTILRGARLIARETIPPGEAVQIVLPWIDESSFPWPGDTWDSRVVVEGAYRMIATRPVIVAQFNPFQYASRGRFSFTNDASLLLPSHALGTEHVAVSHGPLSAVDDAGRLFRYPGYIALVGVASTSEIAITLTADVAPDTGGRWAAARAGETIRFTLARGELATITPAVPPACDPTRPGFVPSYADEPAAGGSCPEVATDLTGSRIVSDHPVAAFGGHACANIPFDVAACDHLETTLAPVATWGDSFETMPMIDPATSVPNRLRIVAAHDGTEITITPPQGGVDPGRVLDAGEWAEITFADPISIRGSHPIEIAQYLLGQNIVTPPLERGDPGMTTLVPQDQFRTDYVFVTPSSYVPLVSGQSWLLVSREPGMAIELDGRPIDATWSRVGDRELARVAVDGGAHHASSSAAFGLIAYGLGLYTSYAYPAGLDLRVIPF